MRMLFVGESPPNGGTFFYAADSALFRHTQAAFSAVLGDDCGNGIKFLNFFKASGCFLEDLCQTPVDGMEAKQRKQEWQRAIPTLAARLAPYRPSVIVGVVKSIKSHVCQAITQAGIKPTKMYFLPFPGQWWFKTYEEDLANLLRENGRLLIEIEALSDGQKAHRG